MLLSSQTSDRLYKALLALALTLLSLPSMAMNWNFPSSSGAPNAAIYGVAALPPNRVIVLAADGNRSVSTDTFSWSPLPALSPPRSGMALVTLASGQVMAIAGSANLAPSNVVERFDGTSNTWSPLASLNVPRVSAVAVQLASGKVLVVGGRNANQAPIRSAELLDATAGVWTEVAAPLWDVDAGAHALFALADGRAALKTTTGIGLYDPASNTWSNVPPPPTAANLPAPRTHAAQVSDGRIVISKMGVYDPVGNVWAPMQAPPRNFDIAAAIPGGRVLFSGGELVPCTPSLFCQASYAYEYSPATDAWTDLGNTVGAWPPAVATSNGAYVALVNQLQGSGYAYTGALYQRSRTHQIYFSNGLDLPLSPSAGESYGVELMISTTGDVLSRPMTGAFTISDGSAQCQFTRPGNGCTLTTTVAGPKTLTVTYPGDANYEPASATYQPIPHAIVSRNTSTRVSSNPGGIYDVGFLYQTAYPFAAGTAVTLTANVAIGGYVFTGWLGDCTGTSTCSFTMPADRHFRVKAYGAPGANAPFNVDVDRDGVARASTDGAQILRYLLAYPEAAVVNGTMPAAGAPPGGAVTGYLDGIRPKLDIDGNGSADARTDGLLILRYLMGMRGQALIADCVGVNAVRSSATDIETYLATLLP